MITGRRQFLKCISCFSLSALLASQSRSLFANGKNVANSGIFSNFTLQSAWINDAESIGYFVAIDNGYYQKEGLYLNYLPGGPDIIPESFILSGKADVALAATETVIGSISKQKAPLVVIGAQYQKSPIGIVSLASNPIKSPQDLIGKKLAVPPVSRFLVDAMLKLNGINKSDVRIVPYIYDPTPLLKGEVDASLDFVTNVPYTIKANGKDALSFLLADFKLPIFNNVVVTTKNTLLSRRQFLVSFLRASRKGWEENFKDPTVYPKKFKNSWFKGTGRSIENEIFFNTSQKSLMKNINGIFSMSEDDIQKCIDALNSFGLKANRDHFDTSLLGEI